VIGYTGGRAPLAEAHPDWLARRKDGSTELSWAGTTRSCWIAHAHPEGQQFLLDLMWGLAANYDVPAIQFDRARYPELNCGCDDATLALYAAEHDGLEPPADERNAEWMRWRASKLNEFVVRLGKTIKSANWRVLSTSAPIGYDYSYVNFLQEYPAWVKAGALDFVSPQVCRSDLDGFTRELDKQIAALDRDGARLVPGIDVTKGGTEVLIRSIEACRERSLPGVVISYYDGLAQKGSRDRLKETVFQAAVPLPWK